MEYRITDDIDKLMAVLPPYLVENLEYIGNLDRLVEVVMDLGRVPSARYFGSNPFISNSETTREEIDYVVSRLGGFDADNRGGIERTLHRISAIRNRAGDVVGLTCRVGRAVYGTIDIIEDLILSGKSVLILGAPGVGKTTMLRETARIVADSGKRVVIVDTSNEIGGDGDIPHPAIGLARRMQVAEPALQHEVMIEAVENHNPEVIVIDEIGRELEARAARTIAERGVQLIGTAHGNTLENLLRNPTLSDLVGGIQAVTLSDEEARRRRTQKTVLERRSPPTFEVLIEIQTRDQMVIHDDIGAAVDANLRGYPRPAELRSRDEHGTIHKQTVVPDLEQSMMRRPQNQPTRGTGRPNKQPVAYDEFVVTEAESMPSNGKARRKKEEVTEAAASNGTKRTIQVYAYGVPHGRILEAAGILKVSVEIVENMTNADVLVTTKNYYRRRPKLVVDAERRNIPIHVLRANTEGQVENFLVDIFHLEDSKERDPFEVALEDVRQAVSKIRAGEESVDLKPQVAHIRRRQHELIRAENLASHSQGSEPNRYVRVSRQELN